MDILHRPFIFNAFPQISAGQSTRHGGVSTGIFNSLNLGKSTTDVPENVAENRRRFLTTLGFSEENLALSHQVHGTEIYHATTPALVEGFDAIITNTPCIVVGVSIADCTPILLFDKKNIAVAAIHAGWRGTAGAIVSKTLAVMVQQFGSCPNDIFAYIGACISEKAFEVGDEVAIHFANPFRRWDTEKGKFFVNLKKANADQLLQFGVPASQIEISESCTFGQSEHFFSHRKEQGKTGRMLAAIGIL